MPTRQTSSLIVLLMLINLLGLVPTSAAREPATRTLGIVEVGVAENADSGSVTIAQTGKIAQFSPPSDLWEVVFVSDRDGNPELYAMNANGSNLRRLTENEALDGRPQWSPDGTQIVFYSARDGNLEIYLIDDDGSNPRNLTHDPAPDYDPAWSPDGSHIVFVSERDGSPDLYTMPASGGEATRLIDETDRAAAPIWSPDGTQIVYNATNNGVVEVRLANADGTNPHPIIDLFGANGLHPDWAPNGTLISFNADRDGTGDIYVMQPDGSGATRLTAESSWPTTTAFAPDSQWVAYMAGYTGYADLYVTDIAGQQVFRLTETEFDDSQPDWRTLAPAVPAAPCAIRTDREDYVMMYVGPGRERGQFGWMPANQDFRVNGQALDPENKLWFEIDKTQISGTEMVNSLWVMSEDVQIVGDCSQVEFIAPPPVIVNIPPQDTPTWGPCGSCDTCGHTNECVTAPDGQCLWDPATCHYNPGGDPGGDPGDDPGTECYRLARANAVVSPDYNCTNGAGYASGTVVNATASGSGTFTNWTGTCPGVNGSTSPQISFTMTFGCSITANFVP